MFGRTGVTGVAVGGDGAQGSCGCGGVMWSWFRSWPQHRSASGSSRQALSAGGRLGRGPSTEDRGIEKSKIEGEGYNDPKARKSSRGERSRSNKGREGGRRELG